MKSCFLVALGLLLSAAVAMANIPHPDNCTVPPCLVVCPAGDDIFTVVLRDVAYNPVWGCDVTLDFSACPAFHLCPDCCANLTIDLQNRRVTAISDVNGIASFPLKMGGVCAGATVGVYAAGAGLYLGSVPMASPDQDGNLVVDAADAAHVNSLIGTHDPGADFDCDGTVTQADFAWLVNNHDGHSCTGMGAPALPLLPPWGLGALAVLMLLAGSLILARRQRSQWAAMR
jgi:hypothetical protein